MFEKYFAEFHVSEEELKENIYSSLKFLNELEPEKWSAELLETANPNNPSQEILASLAHNIPELSVALTHPSEWELIEYLRLSAIRLSMILNSKYLEYYFTKHLYMVSSAYLLGFRYLVAMEVLSEKLNKEPKYSPDNIFSILTNEAFNTDKFQLVYIAVKAAHNEIQRVFTDKNANGYVNQIIDFERDIEKYIKDNSASFVLESIVRLVNEAVAKNLGKLATLFQVEDDLSNADKRKMVDGIMKIIKRSAKRRLELDGWGGKRDRKGFVWTDEIKIAFYNKVETLRKTDSRYNWQFVLAELKEAEFDSDTISWLRTRPNIKDFPEALFNNAIKVWRKYLHDENWDEMKTEDKPRAFEYRHALYLLGYKDDFKFTTLHTYYKDGKRFFKNGGFQNGDLKISEEDTE